MGRQRSGPWTLTYFGMARRPMEGWQLTPLGRHWDLRAEALEVFELFATDKSPSGGARATT